MHSSVRLHTLAYARSAQVEKQLIAKPNVRYDSTALLKHYGSGPSISSYWEKGDARTKEKWPLTNNLAPVQCVEL